MPEIPRELPEMNPDCPCSACHYQRDLLSRGLRYIKPCRCADCTRGHVEPVSVMDVSNAQDPH